MYQIYCQIFQEHAISVYITSHVNHMNRLLWVELWEEFKLLHNNLKIGYDIKIND